MQLTYSDLLKRKWRTLAGGELGPIPTATALEFKGNANRQAILIQNSTTCTLVVGQYSYSIASSTNRDGNWLIIDRYTFGDLVTQGFTLTVPSGTAIVGETYIAWDNPNA